MKDFLNKKSVGFYFLVLAEILAVISLVRFFLWAPQHNATDMIIVVALIAGLALNLFLGFKDNDYVIILTTVCYSIAVVKLLTNSVGSFVDAFQGIKMFGDSTQVGTILSISILILISVLMSIIASFFKRVKE
jgi:hypothetical protein